MAAIAFDVYGTLVDPLAMNRHLQRLVGDQADRFAVLWREKQVEYAFRRGLMRAYQPFDLCTRQALLYTMRVLGVELSEADQTWLLEQYQSLPAFPDAVAGLEALRGQGHTLVAFSNGREAVVRLLLGRAGLLPYLDSVISVDDVATFKPDPAVYTYLVQRLNRERGTTWLVSGNAWDVIGAKSAGLKAAWLRRVPGMVFDPWGIEPDLVVSDLRDLSTQLASEAHG